MTATTASPRIIRPLRDELIAIPATFRQILGIGGETMLRATMAEGGLRVALLQVDEPAKESSWLRELYELYAPVRADILARGISQEELYADIDAAISEVRAESAAARAQGLPSEL